MPVIIPPNPAPAVVAVIASRMVCQSGPPSPAGCIAGMVIVLVIVLLTWLLDYW